MTPKVWPKAAGRRRRSVKEVWGMIFEDTGEVEGVDSRNLKARNVYICRMVVL
jgi:hypothetical protein